MRNSADRGSVQAVERAADLLLILAGSEEPPTLRELSQQVGYSQSTALRLLTALEKKGLVERDAHSKRYRIGVLSLALANGRSRQLDLHTRALPYLRTLRDGARETVSLHVRSGRQHVCVLEVEGSHEVRHRVEVGRLFPVERGSTGKVLQAFGDEGQAADPLAGHAASGGSLPRTLEAARIAGFATSIEEREPGVSGMSAPIFDASGRVWAAVTISGPVERFGPEQMLTLSDPLKRTAAAISRELGYRADVGARRRDVS